MAEMKDVLRRSGLHLQDERSRKYARAQIERLEQGYFLRNQLNTFCSFSLLIVLSLRECPSPQLTLYVHMHAQSVSHHHAPRTSKIKNSLHG